MASSATPYGAVPIGTLSASGSYTGKVRHIPIASGYSSAIMNGDFVKLVAGGGVALDIGTAALTTCGIFMGCSYTPSSTDQKTFNTQWPASTVASDAVAYVLDDPDVLFQMQADGPILAVERGANYEVNYLIGSTAIGKSKGTVDASTMAVTATFPVRLIDFVDGPNSSAGDLFTDVVCKFNAATSSSVSTHQYRNATGIAA